MSEGRAEKILDEIKSLPPKERLNLVERIIHDFAEDKRAILAEEVPASEGASIIGLFRDEADLIEEICEDAMRARERDPLRRRHA